MSHHDPRLVARVQDALVRSDPGRRTDATALLDALQDACLAVVVQHHPRTDDGLYPTCPACATPTPATGP